MGASQTNFSKLECDAFFSLAFYLCQMSNKGLENLVFTSDIVFS